MVGVQLLIGLSLCVLVIEAKSSLVLEDRAAIVGQKFTYQIGNKDFQTTYKVYRIVERGSKRLPEWLTYDANSSSLVGVPLQEHVRVYTIRVKASCIDDTSTECQGEISKTFQIVVKEELPSSPGSRGSHTFPVHGQRNAVKHDEQNFNSSYQIIIQHDNGLVMTSTSEALHDNSFISSGLFTNRLLSFSESWSTMHESSVSLSSFREYWSTMHESSVSLSSFSESWSTMHDSSVSLSSFSESWSTVHESSVSLSSFSESWSTMHESSVSLSSFSESWSTVHESSVSSPQTTSFQCKPDEVSFYVTLVLHVVDAQLSVVEQAFIIHQLSLFISKRKELISLSETEADMISIKSGKKHILVAGPGNVIESQKQSMELTWLAACGNYENLRDFSRVLQHNIDCGRITKEIGYNVIAWYIYTDRKLSKREKRNAHNMRRQTKTPSFTLSVPTRSESVSSLTHFTLTPTSPLLISSSYFPSTHTSFVAVSKTYPSTFFHAVSSQMSTLQDTVSNSFILTSSLDSNSSFLPSASLSLDYSTYISSLYSKIFSLSSYSTPTSSHGTYSSGIDFNLSSISIIGHSTLLSKSYDFSTSIVETPLSLHSTVFTRAMSTHIRPTSYLTGGTTVSLEFYSSITMSIFNTSKVDTLFTSSYIDLSLFKPSSLSDSLSIITNIISSLSLTLSEHVDESDLRSVSTSPDYTSVLNSSMLPVSKTSFQILDTSTSRLFLSSVLIETSAFSTRTLTPSLNFSMLSTVFSSHSPSSFIGTASKSESPMHTFSSTSMLYSLSSFMTSSFISPKSQTGSLSSLPLSEFSTDYSTLVSSSVKSVTSVFSVTQYDTSQYPLSSTQPYISSYITLSLLLSSAVSTYIKTSDSGFTQISTQDFISPFYNMSTSLVESSQYPFPKSSIPTSSGQISSDKIKFSVDTSDIISSSSVSFSSIRYSTVLSELSSTILPLLSSTIPSIFSSLESLHASSSKRVFESSILPSSRYSFKVERSSSYEASAESYLTMVSQTTLSAMSSMTEELPSISPTPVLPSTSVSSEFPLSSVVTPTVSPDDDPPTLQNSIDHLPVTIGRYFQFQVPENTFNDTEDGGTRNLNLSVNLLYSVPFPADAWLMFNSVTQTLYGIPLHSDFESDDNVIKKFLLMATDSKGQVAKDVISLSYRAEKDVNHKISVGLNTSFKSFDSSNSNLITFAQNIATVFNDSSLKHLSFFAVQEGSVIITWGNVSLFGIECRLGEIQKLFAKIIDTNGSFTEEFLAVFSSLSPISGVLNFEGSCLFPVTTPSPPTASPASDGMWIEILLPALIVILVIVIIALLLLVCCRHRQAGSKSTADKPTFLEDRRPIIFPEELEMMDPSLKAKQPLILPSDHIIESAPVVPAHGEGSSPAPPSLDDGDLMGQPLPTYGSTTNTMTDPPPYRLPPPYYNPHRV